MISQIIILPPSQVFPVKGKGHSQVKSPISSIHLPLFKHGLFLQSSILTSHSSPSNPFKHSQRYCPISFSKHDPPFLHGADLHSSISIRRKLLLTSEGYSFFLFILGSANLFHNVSLHNQTYNDNCNHLHRLRMCLDFCIYLLCNHLYL